ncbi:hypothetical protein FGE12_16460 [Aggregicoccus sp. 17bor-14]|uniref:hypothetical protein n=1 Tax=Myxococcaceae TaxID=31 RepID=UPI00129C1511|nr:MULTISPECIES: hypothetical protein [Myxococcaceae]MBF5043992.1 hypothetical protein [Simulacricoccus sp. 17bor-14]MRI89743.1 hypothetical protein [Aggregicoccus sp. 17bor-14]
MGIRKNLKQQAMGVSQKAMEKLFADEQRAMKIASAIGTVQRGKKALDRSQDELMRVLHLAPKSDFKALGKQLSGLKRRLRALEEKVAAISGE